MSALAAVAVLAAFVAAAALTLPAARRTALGVWHPAVIWLALEAVFFGLGSAVLAIDGRTGPAWFVSGYVIAFAVAVAASDRLAGRRARGEGVATVAAGSGDLAASAVAGSGDPAPLRWVVVAGLAVLGVAAVAPTLVRVGLPFLTRDITGARIELAGLSVQALRVAIPALALGLLLTSREADRRRRTLSYLAIGALLAFDLVLASRYLAAELGAVLLVGLGLAGWHIPLRRLAAVALLALVAFGGIQILRAYDQAEGRELDFAIERTVNRVILIQPRTLEALQGVIPSEQPYFGGLTWVRRLGPAFGRSDIPNLGYWIYPRIFPDQADVAGYAAPGIAGEAWANFGPAGLALFALLGIGVERLGAVVARRRPGTGDLVAGALATVFVARTHALGVNGVAILLLLVIAWRVLAAGGVGGLWRDVRTALAWR